MSIELPDPQAPPKRNVKTLAIAAGAGLLVLGGLVGTAAYRHNSPPPPTSDMLQCKQPPLIVPDFAAHGVADLSIFATPEYRNYSIEVLAGAVRIPTVSYDDMSFDVDKEPRFKIFHKLHKYFERHFPLLTKHREFVNTYGLLYTIPGTNPDLKPLVLMAHQDVVPVAPATRDEWTEDPFGGVFDGEWLHGRGTCDTKNTLVAMHEAVEALLQQKWHPARTLLISAGFDEEISGFRGARKLAELLERRYGPDSVEMLIDEGLGVAEAYGQYFATPAVAEKGRLNFRFTLNTPGGHSSAPPDHTGIGIMAELVTRLESDVPLPPTLSEFDVIKGRYACFGQFANDELSSSLRGVYTHLGSPAVASELAEILGADRHSRVMVETTQAIDIVHGGVKINALPEQVIMEVNYRIKPDSSVDRETKRVLDFVTGLAQDFHLGANFTNAFNPGPDDTPRVLAPEAKDQAGFLLVETTDVLEVAPVSPFYNDSHWDVLSGTTKHVFQAAGQDFVDRPVVMAPGLMTGNTDTAHYWNLTKNLYRYFPALESDMQNIHTVNEALRPRSHFSIVAFFYELVLNLDNEL